MQPRAYIPSVLRISAVGLRWACVLQVDTAKLGECDSSAQTKRNPTGYEWNIHFWLGEETTKVCVLTLLHKDGRL